MQELSKIILAYLTLIEPYFSNVAVISYCLFNNSTFIADSIGYAVKFEEVCFESITDFSEAQFDVGVQSTVGFQRSQFKDTVDFRSARFEEHVVFDSVAFDSYSEFIVPVGDG